MSMNKRDEGKMKEVIGSVEEIVLEVPDDASANISEVRIQNVWTNNLYLGLV